MQKGIEDYDQGLYDAALVSFKEIHPADTNYAVARYEEGLTLIALEKYPESREAFREVLTMVNGDHVQSLINIATSFDREGMVDSAVYYYDKCIERFPWNASAWYNRGVTYENNKEFDKAFEDYKYALTLNPAHARSHYRLGVLAANQGLYTRAILSWTTCILYSSSTEQSYAAVVSIDQMVGGNWEEEESLKGLDAAEFKELNLFVKNKLALRDDYDYPLARQLNLDVSRNTHLVLSEIKFDKRSDDFWMQHYVPTYTKIEKNGMFEALLYAQVISVGKVEDAVRTKLNDVRELYGWFNKEWREDHSIATIRLSSGEMAERDLLFRDSGQVGLCGTKKGDKFVGEAEYYQPSGCLMSKGEFNNNEENIGVWRYYTSNGIQNQELTYKDGKLNGPFTIWFNNGLLSQKAAMKDGKLHGVSAEFAEDGHCYGRFYYEDGNKSGETTTYYKSGAVKEKLFYKEGNLHGDLISYHANGGKDYESTYDEGKVVGEARWYHPNRELLRVATYNDQGLLDGELKEYSADGRLVRKAKYKEDELEGSDINYWLNGNVSKTSARDPENDKIVMVTYHDLNGQLIEENTSKKGEVTSYRQIDRFGNVLAEEKKKGGDFYYKDFRGDGVLVAEGEYEPGDKAKKGVWKRYDEYGNLSSVSNYKADEYHGDYEEYHSNGQLKYRSVYENGQPVGTIERFSLSGIRTEEGNYSNGKRCGVWTEWHPDGETVSEVYYVTDGELNGERSFFDVEGKILRTDIYEEGRFIGTRSYTADGEVYFETRIDTGLTLLEVPFPGTDVLERSIRYEYGVANGPARWYYPNGDVFVEGEYLEDQRHGTWKWYHTNGKLRTVYTYMQGNLQGTTRRFHENGELDNIDFFVGNESDTLETDFTEAGTVQTRSPYQGGIRHGLAEYYSEDGKLQMVRRYYHGRIDSIGWLDSSGESYKWIAIDPQKRTEVTTYYPNGKKARSFTLDKGNFDGPYRKYFDNGQPEEVTIYDNDVLAEEELRYSRDGILLERSPYAHGVLHGKHELFYASGKPRRVTLYVLGKRHGEETLYDEQGKVKAVHVWRDDTLIEMK